MLKKKGLTFEVGRWMFFKLRPHQQQTVPRRINQKLAPRFFGSFPLIDKKVVGDYVVDELAKLEDELDKIEEHEVILVVRDSHQGDQLVRLVR
ncbi:hypothetical protein PHAVU_009G010400 [Phaseolus vulgaris]|uniref:Uncharacterized protein n=1 Tax=Phaseolus vulgaris TaxID=3885 RepID=V7ARR8_PHAVU|nr:hypothetical protein PHAVU_009G010400g [Phaseolus vulgaris]ESW08005.1 hypothetical protein PHAVU_009G010400g [Phaseolus vulgaris]